MADAVPNRIFINGVPPHASKEDVGAYFAQFGSTSDVYVPMAFGTTQHKGIAFVTFEDSYAAHAVLQHPTHFIGDVQVSVEQCVSRKGDGKGAAVSSPGGFQYQVPAGKAGELSIDTASKRGNLENRIFINQLPQTADKNDVATYFAQFGPTSDVYVPLVFGRNGQQHKGIAYVTFQQQEAMQLVMQNPTGHIIGGHQIIVDFCAPKKGDGKGFGGGGGFAPAAPQQVDQARLFVSKIGAEVTQAEVQAYFQEYGAWTDFYMPAGNFPAGHKGIAFITYADPGSIHLVLQNGPHSLREQPVVVDVAAPRDEKGKGKGKGFGFQQQSFAPQHSYQPPAFQQQGYQPPHQGYQPPQQGYQPPQQQGYQPPQQGFQQQQGWQQQGHRYAPY
eukprot:TRINITY_DN176_c1_g1_i2.p1 TRINITY_DN176_c1_g1~~TRINITY_DN176_c1_g1_i2.p1  ORF type:complete len:388 (-),score=100.17 TRINITY_DN176_c1_g1_i2:15-1178(-)